MVTHETRIREVPGSNPRFFRGFTQSSRQMLGWIFITTIHLSIIHNIHKSQIFTQEKLARGSLIQDEFHTVVPISGGRLLRHRDIKVYPTVWQLPQFRRWICWKNSSALTVSVPINLSINGRFLKRKIWKPLAYVTNSLKKLRGSGQPYLVNVKIVLMWCTFP